MTRATWRICSKTIEGQSGGGGGGPIGSAVPEPGKSVPNIDKEASMLVFQATIKMTMVSTNKKAISVDAARCRWLRRKTRRREIK
jgi:hypothetical protein